MVINVPLDIRPGDAGGSLKRLRGQTCSVWWAVAGLVSGAALGFGIHWLRDDPHTAGTRVVTGTVTWVNQETRLVIIDNDNPDADAGPGDTWYSVIADGWRDADGTGNSTGGYPPCMADDGQQPPRGPRRVRMWVVDVGADRSRQQHIAVRVQCLG